MDQNQLRALVARMQEHVALAARPTATEDDRRELSRSWNALVTHLNVEPAPDVRACPQCRREIMRAATYAGTVGRSRRTPMSDRMKADTDDGTDALRITAQFREDPDIAGIVPGSQPPSEASSTRGEV